MNRLLDGVCDHMNLVTNSNSCVNERSVHGNSFVDNDLQNMFTPY